MFNKPASEVNLLNKSSNIATAVGVTKFTTIILSNLVALSCAFKSHLDVLHTSLRSQSVEQKLKGSHSYRCDQIHNNNFVKFSRTLLCSLSPTKMFNKPASQVNLLNKSSRLTTAVGVTKFTTIIVVNLVTLCFAAYV